MNRKFYKISLCAILTIATTGCSRGEYNDLECDENYQSECIANTKYMACVSNVLTVLDCAEGTYCLDTEVNGVFSASCVKYGASSHHDQPTTCGNGRIDGGEDCDGSNLNGKSCADVVANSAGTLSCSPSTCLFDRTGCVIADCGNGVVEEGEDCDGSDLNGKTCVDLYEGSSGDLSCNSNTCYYDTSSCDVHKPNPELPGCKSDDDCVFEDHPDMVCHHGKCVEEEWKSMNVGDPCDEILGSYGVNNDFRFCSDDDEIVYCDIARDESGEPIVDSEGNTSFVVHKRDCSQLGGCTVYDAYHLSGSTNVYLELACKNDTVLLTNEEADAMCKEDGQMEAYCGNLEGYDEAPLESYYMCVYNHEGEYTALNGAILYPQNYIYCMNLVEDGDAWVEDGYGVCADEKQCENHAIFYCAYDYRCIDSEQVEYCDIAREVAEDIVKCNDLRAGTVCATVGAEDGCYKPCDQLGATRYECTTFTDMWGEKSVASIEYVCAKGRDGNLYETEAGMICSNECGSDGKCVLYAEDENSSCDISTYQARCENNSIVSCIDSRVKSSSCGDTKICHFVTYPNMWSGFNGEPLCLDPCETEGEIKRECEPDHFNSSGVWVQGENSAFVCTQTDDGLVYIENSYANCKYGCTEDESGCKKLLDDIEGNACDNPGEMLDCQGSIIIYCGSDGKIAADECAVISPDATFDSCIKTATGAACTKLCDPSGDIQISEPYYPTHCEYDFDQASGTGKYHYYEKYCEDVNGTQYEFYKIVKECELGCDSTNDFKTCKETED